MSTHHAPPVVYPLGRSRFQGLLLASLWCSGFLSSLLWVYTTGSIDWRICLLWLCLASAGLAAALGWRSAPLGQLAWDGQLWRWESAGYQAGVAEQQISVIADFQHVLWLKIENQAHASLWLWLERAAMPERWLDLRRAVYSPNRTPAHPGRGAQEQPTNAVQGKP